ncbi:MAG: hypothetical protein AB7O31_00220 [Burkholderiales bacterium]
MSADETVVDCNGKQVRVGDRVRLLYIDGNLLERVPDSEAEELRGMIGEIFEVEEIDKYGMAWVSKTVAQCEGSCRGHSLALGAGEMERVSITDAS